MCSGVKVADNVKELLQEMKVNKCTDDAMKRIRIITFHICGEIVVEEIFKEEDLRDKGNTFKFLQTLMKDECCKYIMYDCHYETTVSKKEELVFIMWSCDKAKMKQKMPYASSKSCLKKIIDAKHEFEFHCREEISLEEFADKIKQVAKAEIIAVEGLRLDGSHHDDSDHDDSDHDDFQQKCQRKH